MTILAGADFSEAATRAVDAAAELARAQGAPFVVAHPVDGVARAPASVLAGRAPA